MNAAHVDAVARAQAIRTQIVEARVQAWLDGSTYQNDAITRRELEACGYRIVKANSEGAA